MAAVAPESCELGCWLFCLGCGFSSSHQKQVLLKVVRKEQPEKSVSYWKSIIVFPLSLGLDFIISKVVDLFSVANVTCWDLVRASHDCSTVFKSSGSQHPTIRKGLQAPSCPQHPCPCCHLWSRFSTAPADPAAAAPRSAPRAQRGSPRHPARGAARRAHRAPRRKYYDWAPQPTGKIKTLKMMIPWFSRLTVFRTWLQATKLIKIQSSYLQPPTQTQPISCNSCHITAKTCKVCQLEVVIESR